MSGSHVDEARAQVAALSLHLEALMLTNKSLLSQLEEARQRASTVGAQLQQDVQQRGQLCGRRCRDDEEVADIESDDEGPPKYRSLSESPMRISILSSTAGPHDEFVSHPVNADPESITFRSTTGEHLAQPVDDVDEWSTPEIDGMARSIQLRSGLLLHLTQLKQAVSQIGAMAAMGDGAKDALGSPMPDPSCPCPPPAQLACLASPCVLIDSDVKRVRPVRSAGAARASEKMWPMI